MRGTLLGDELRSSRTWDFLTVESNVFEELAVVRHKRANEELMIGRSVVGGELGQELDPLLGARTEVFDDRLFGGHAWGRCLPRRFLTLRVLGTFTPFSTQKLRRPWKNVCILNAFRLGNFKLMV